MTSTERDLRLEGLVVQSGIPPPYRRAKLAFQGHLRKTQQRMHMLSISNVCKYVYIYIYNITYIYIYIYNIIYI